jgi:D-alanine-D-alanine ligase
MEDAINKALKFDNEILIERFIDGYEFSIIVIQDISGIPIPLFPTEIVINDRTNPIYTRLKKYMPGSGASHRTPASFSDKQIDLIRDQAYDIFLKLNISDWARFDGFLTSDGNIIWSDLNGIPGFGMDSLLFQQSSLFGLDHENFSIFLLLKVAAKSNLQITGISEKRFDAQKVYVLGGGSTSEKQVSRMSWMNVIQKLKCSHHFDIHPVFVDINNDYFEVPSFLTLQHTIEEIECIIKSDFSFVDAANKASVIASMASKTFNQIRKKGSQYPPKKMTLDEISREADFVFIALHGGFGENGQLQLALDNLKTPYNGSGPYVSELCMDKNKTSMFLDDLKIPNFRGSKNFVVDFRKQFSKYISNITQIRTAITSGMSFDVICDTFDLSRFLSAVRERGEQWQQSLTSPKGLVLKPLSDGCSSGVFLWRVGDDGLAIYILCALANINSIAWSYFKGNYESIPDEIMLRLPFESSDLLLIEELHEADDKLNLIELTIAVHGHSGQMQALVPSETRKDFDLLTLEEKFCKGVGVNITPSDKLSSEQIFSIQKRVIAFANSLKIDGYARIDLMYFIDSDDLVLIEVNTLPGLSSATVTFTQALVTENFQMPPSEFLESLIQIKMFR